MLIKEPSERPQSIGDIFKNFTYVAPQDSDFKDSEASEKLFELISSLE